MSQKIFHPLKPKDAPAEGAAEANPAPSEAPAQPTYKPGLATGDLCYIAADHLGLLGPQVATSLYQLRCPWASEHAPHCKQRDGIFDNSTLLFLEGYELTPSERAAMGDSVPPDGGVLCLHEHSAGPHTGVPLNASVFLSYARACGAPLPDRPRYMVDEKDEDETTPLLGADLPPQERCDIDPEEASFTFDAEGEINSGDLSGKDLHELGLYPPGEMRLRTQTKAPSEAEDAASTFDELTNRVSAQLNMPKDAIVSSAAALAKSQGFRIPGAPLSPPEKRLNFAVPAVDWFSAFLSECCIVDADASVPTPDLRGVFEIWYKSNHEGSPPLAQFWKMLAEKGYESDRGSTGSFRLRRGLKLVEQSRAYQEFLKPEAAPKFPAQPVSFTEFVKKANVVTCDGPWGFGHWRIVDALENVLNTDHSLILAPPGAGVPLLAGTLFPAWLMLEKGKRSVLVVCADERVANLRRMFTAHDFPALIPYMEHDAGAMRHATPRLCFVGPNAHLTGSGFDAIILDGTPDVNGGIPDFRYDAFASRRFTGGCMVTITCRQGRNDLASRVMSGGATTVAFPSHMFSDIPDHIDRASGYFFWQYDQCLPIGGMRTAYEPETGVSMFKRFLTMLLTPAMESRLQLLFGGLYSAKLTGTQINAEKVIVHVGAGVNGKTTLFTSLGKVLPVVALCGDVVHDSALLNASLCALWESADKIDDAWLKAAAASVAQVHVTTNRLPMCSDDASARWIEVIKWEQYIPERLRDPDMAQKIARDPNFLIWLAEGLRRYQAGER